MSEPDDAAWIAAAGAPRLDDGSAARFIAVAPVIESTDDQQFQGIPAGAGGGSDTDQSTAYYNSFARGWELLLGALVGALVPYVRWPMWLRTTVATIALVAILSCGAFIDGVKEFPGPWALVPVGATMLFIPSAANRVADPHLKDSPTNRMPGCGPAMC